MPYDLPRSKMDYKYAIVSNTFLENKPTIYFANQIKQYWQFKKNVESENLAE